jgi:hypothetical protein
MTYKEMQIGKTYYKKFVEDKGRSGLKREKTYHKVYVLQKKEDTQEVLASINGLPPEWYGKSKYQRWKFHI